MKNINTKKIVIITGASSGIGAATARRLAREGMHLTLAARRVDKLKQVAEDVTSLGGEVLSVKRTYATAMILSILWMPPSSAGDELMYC